MITSTPWTPCSRCSKSKARATPPGRLITGKESPKNLLQLIGRSRLELLVGAIARRLVGAPAQEARRVPEALALHVVVLHLAHALDAQRLPRQVLARAPAALRADLGAFPGMLFHRGSQRAQFFGKGLAHSHGERRGDADMVQDACLVVEAEEQRADRAGLALVPAEPGDDAFRRACV